jgi:hypothetical protein
MLHLFCEIERESETGEPKKTAINHWMIDRRRLLTGL